MLNDFSSWFRSGLEYIMPFGFTDSEFKSALVNCYDGLCSNKYNSGRLMCPLNLDDVGAVILSYIAYFTMSEHLKSKYYYDEYSDRKDPYRIGLVGIISRGAREYNNKITDEFTNDVLSYLYWLMKDGRCPKSILRPKNEERFKDLNWYIKQPYRSIVAINERIYNLMINVFKTGAKAVEVVLDGVNSVIDLTSSALDIARNTASGASFLIKNLPYILTGGIVLFSGVQIYGKRKNGKFYGEDTAIKVIKNKAGLADG